MIEFVPPLVESTRDDRAGVGGGDVVVRWRRLVGACPGVVIGELQLAPTAVSASV